MTQRPPPPYEQVYTTRTEIGVPLGSRSKDDDDCLTDNPRCNTGAPYSRMCAGLTCVSNMGVDMCAGITCVSYTGAAFHTQTHTHTRTRALWLYAPHRRLRAARQCTPRAGPHERATTLCAQLCRGDCTRHHVTAECAWWWNRQPRTQTSEPFYAHVEVCVCTGECVSERKGGCTRHHATAECT